jgi:hypothetical protein
VRHDAKQLRGRAAGTGSCGSGQRRKPPACRGGGSAVGELLAAHALPLRWWCQYCANYLHWLCLIAARCGVVDAGGPSSRAAARGDQTTYWALKAELLAPRLIPRHRAVRFPRCCLLPIAYCLLPIAKNPGLPPSPIPCPAPPLPL